MEKMSRYVISSNAYPCSMIVIQLFDINYVLWATVDMFSHCKKQRYAKTCISVKLITLVLIANTFSRATEHIINTTTD